MFVVVEGIHNTGKTTLVDSLRSSFKVFSCRRSFSDLTNSKNVQLTDFSFGVNCSIVWFAENMSVSNDVLFDRLHVSEYAYSVAIRGADEVIAFRNFRMIDTALSAQNVKMIFLTCSYETICDRLKDKNRIYTEDDYRRLLVSFDKAQSATLIPSIAVNTATHSPADVLELALDFIHPGDR